MQETSLEAFASIEPVLGERQQAVLDFFRSWGPATDEDISSFFGNQHDRKRRPELVAAGILHDTGERRKSASGRNVIVWDMI